MPRYNVKWTEMTHYESEVDAATPEEAQELCMSNLGDWQDCSIGGYEEDSIFIREVSNA